MTFIQAALCICHISDALHTQQATVYGAEKLGHIIYDLLICQTFMLFSEFSSFKGIKLEFLHQSHKGFTFTVILI